MVPVEHAATAIRRKVPVYSEPSFTDQGPRSSNLWFWPLHDGHRADAVLRAARDNPVAVRHVNQDIALAIEEAHDLKRLEHEAALFVEDALAVLELAEEPNRPDLATGNAGVARILRYAQAPLTPPVWAREIWQATPWTLGSSKPSTTILSLGPSHRNWVLTEPVVPRSATLEPRSEEQMISYPR